MSFKKFVYSVPSTCCSDNSIWSWEAIPCSWLARWLVSVSWLV